MNSTARNTQFETWRWGNLTAPEIRDVGSEPGSIFVLPIGSIEQHGNHMPTATDSILVEAVCDEVVERLSSELPTVLGPTVWSGHSPHHRDFGGTLSLTFDTMKQVLSEIVDSALDNDFDAVALVNGHGGNINLVGAATGEIGRQHPETEVIGLTYFQLAAEAISDIRESELGGMNHAGEYETALMLKVMEELVRADLIESSYYQPNYPADRIDLIKSGPVSIYRSFAEYSDSGMIGDATLASAEKGELIFEVVTDELESILRDVSKHSVTS